MSIVMLDRTFNALRIAENLEDLEAYRNVTVLYEITHITPCSNGWYDIYQGKHIAGHLSDVTEVKETW